MCQFHEMLWNFMPHFQEYATLTSVWYTITSQQEVLNRNINLVCEKIHHTVKLCGVFSVFLHFICSGHGV